MGYCCHDNESSDELLKWSETATFEQTTLKSIVIDMGKFLHSASARMGARGMASPRAANPAYPKGGSGLRRPGFGIRRRALSRERPAILCTIRISRSSQGLARPKYTS